MCVPFPCFKELDIDRDISLYTDRFFFSFPIPHGLLVGFFSSNKVCVSFLGVLLENTTSLAAETREVDSVSVREATMLVGPAPILGSKEGSVPGLSPSLNDCPGFGLLHMAFSLSAYLCIPSFPS